MTRKFLVLFLLAVLVGVESTHAAVGRVVHDVLAAAAGDRMWVATVSKGAGAIEQTSILIRAAGPGQEWHTLSSLPARVVAMTARGTTLVVLLEGGDYIFIWGPEGASTGKPLPAGGRIKTIAGDVDHLWAVGSVHGGMAALKPMASTSASTEPAASVEPTVSPVPASQPGLPLELVLFEMVAGDWIPRASMPADAAALVDQPVAFNISAGRPLLALLLNDAAVRTLSWSADHGWHDEQPVELTKPAADFELIDSASTLRLWAGSENSPGRLYPLGQPVRPGVDLVWNGEGSPKGLPAVMSAGGYLRLIGRHDDRLFEQRYDLDGTPIGNASQLLAPMNIQQSPLRYWLRGLFLAALGFSLMATVYRRAISFERPESWKPPVPAPLTTRLMAGLIDLAPMLVALAIIGVRTDLTRDPLSRLEDTAAVLTYLAAAGVYIAHTTTAEFLTGKSVGKWVFGLRVVTIDNAPPAKFQFIIRNGLRILDLLWFPLLLILISPLRQRSADVAAGTMVVADVAESTDKEASNLSE